MSARSLRIAPEKIAHTKSALKRCAFASQQALATECDVSLSTAKAFLNGRSVDRLNFIELCDKLGLDWQEVAAVEADGVETESFAGLEESPFVVGPPITKPRQFFGRERELRRLFNLLKRLPLQNAVIIGPRRAGKTSLLYYLMRICTTPESELRPGQKNDWLPNPERYCWVYVDFQDVRVQSRVGLMTQLLKGMGLAWRSGAEPSLEGFMDVVSEGLRGPTVVLMDEVGAVFEQKNGLARCPELDDGFWESLRALATTQTNGMLGFVLATPENPVELARNNGHSSPFFNIFGYAAQLGPWTENEAVAWIDGSKIDFTPEDKVWIGQQSQGWPILLQALCQEYWFGLEEDLSQEDWQNHGMSQILQYKHLLRLF